jgi:guanine nucleotide-binding protein subunit beta-2-like 1 protein
MECIGQLEGHNGRVTALALGEDANKNTILVSGGRDKLVIVWDLNLGAAGEHEEGDEAAEISKTKLGKPLKALHGHNNFISSISISDDLKHVASSSWDKTIRLWDLATYKTKKLYSGHSKDCLSVVFSGANKRMLVSGSMDNSLRVWNANGELKHTANEASSWVSCLKNIKCGKENLLAAGSWDNKIRFYDDEFLLTRVFTNDYPISSLAASNDGDFLFAAEKNGSIKVWSLGPKEANAVETAQQTLNLGSELYDIAYDTKYYSVIAAATQRGLVIRDISSNKDVYDTKDVAPKQSCHCLTWDQSKTHLFAGFNDGTIRVFKFNQFDEE